MIIIQGKCGTGVKNKLIKEFCKDSNSATLITDQLVLSDIFYKMKEIDNLDELNWCENKEKHILTSQFTNCDADCYKIISNINTTSVYIDLCFSKEFKEDIIKFCLQMEREYGNKYIMTETLPSSSKIEGINVIKLESEV